MIDNQLTGSVTFGHTLLVLSAKLVIVVATVFSCPNTLSALLSACAASSFALEMNYERETISQSDFTLAFMVYLVGG